IFPGETIEVGNIVGFSSRDFEAAHDKNKDKVEVLVVGCITYRWSEEGLPPHSTGFAFFVRRQEPNTKELVDLPRNPTQVPAEQIRLIAWNGVGAFNAD